MIPTTTNCNTNHFAALAVDDDDDVGTDLSHPTHNNTQTSTALSDSGATSHFIAEGTHVINKQVDHNPITITLPDGATLKSSHTCNVDIPWLRHSATKAHIVPGLAHASLLSTAKFCDAGYVVTFDAQHCKVFDGRTLVLEGGRDTATNLWHLPLNPQTLQQPCTMTMENTPTPPQELHNVYTIPHLQNRVKFMHQVFFSPPIQTLLRAANLGFLDGFPFLTAELIHKHLPKSPATAKGRLKLVQAGHRSTRMPRHHVANTNIFCYAALADKQHGTFYTDCTGKLPTRALDGQQLFFIAYDYDTNYIFAIPIDSTKSEHIMAAFDTVVTTL